MRPLSYRPHRAYSFSQRLSWLLVDLRNHLWECLFVNNGFWVVVAVAAIAAWALVITGCFGYFGRAIR